MRTALFVVASIVLLVVSRRALRVFRSHGFYRFFAWEAILALVVINSSVWFADPLSLLQLASWGCLLVSLLLLVPGGYQLLAQGKPTRRREDDTLMDFEKTSVLVTSGLYGYIRHPLYGSLLFLAWGAFLKGPAWYCWCLIVIATAGLVATAKADEVECQRYFGPAYKEYMGKTRMFIPFVY
jgi:protein-S-isoprenylcysteine O-methyltransferase Ste14